MSRIPEGERRESRLPPEEEGFGLSRRRARPVTGAETDARESRAVGKGLPWSVGFELEPHG